MNKIYFDNSSTSFPKAPSLGTVVGEFIEKSCLNINRGLYEDSFSTTSLVIETRQLLAKLFNAQNFKNVIFTSGITQSINIVINGIIDVGYEVITSNMEHNAVVRPLHYNKNISKISYFNANADSTKYAKEIESLITPKTKLIIVCHESNITGNTIDLKVIGDIAKKYNILFVVDTAQSAGRLSIDMQRDNINILCFTGHKSLLAPQGIGGFILDNETVNILRPTNVGGSGIKSDDLYMPNITPEKYEAGTLNLSGIVGLNHSIKYIQDEGIEKIDKHCVSLRNYFLESIKDINNIEVYLPIEGNYLGSLVSISFTNIDNSTATFMLDSNYNIMVRSGLHCAFMAHKSAGSYPNGLVRFSFGYFNTYEEIDIAIGAIKEIAKISDS